MSDLLVNTDQEALDTVVRHLATMQGQAVDDEGDCVYRTGDPRRPACAIGALMSDSTAKGLLTNTGVESLVENGELKVGAVTVELLVDLQDAHDLPSSWHGGTFVTWEKLRRTASKFGLDQSAVDEVTADD